MKTDEMPVYLEFEWREVQIDDLFDWFQGKSRLSPGESDIYPENFPDSDRPRDDLFLSDGSVCCVFNGECRGPYSELTPDLDEDPPAFWVGIPVSSTPAST